MIKRFYRDATADPKNQPTKAIAGRNESEWGGEPVPTPGGGEKSGKELGLIGNHYCTNEVHDGNVLPSNCVSP